MKLTTFQIKYKLLGATQDIKIEKCNIATDNDNELILTNFYNDISGMREEVLKKYFESCQYKISFNLPITYKIKHCLTTQKDNRK